MLSNYLMFIKKVFLVNKINKYLAIYKGLGTSCDIAMVNVVSGSGADSGDQTGIPPLGRDVPTEPPVESKRTSGTFMCLIAHQVEQLTFNQLVVGSNPTQTPGHRPLG